MCNKRAFTLTELLVALGIVGVIAALAIPSLLNDINKRLMVNQLKNTVGFIQQLASEQLVTYKTYDLNETDFAFASALFTTSNFAIARTCTSSTSAKKDCWKTTADSDPITYRNIANKKAISPAYYYTAVLKNGVILQYQPVSIDYDGDQLIGEFCLDVNGNEGPNIAGRDYFCFYVTKTGKIVGDDTNYSTEKKIEECELGEWPHYCTSAIIESGWKMTY